MVVDPVTLTILGLTGLGAGIATGQSSGPSYTSASRGTYRRPVTESGAEDLVNMQLMLQLGANPDQIAEDYVFSQIGTNMNPKDERAARGMLGTINAKLIAGDTAGAQQWLDLMNLKLRSQYAMGFSAPAQAYIDPKTNTVKFNLGDSPAGRFVDEARQYASQIQSDRMRSIAASSSLLAETDPKAIEAYLNQKIDELEADEWLMAEKMGTLPQGIDRLRTMREGVSTVGVPNAIAARAGASQAINAALIPSLLPAQQTYQSLGAGADQAGLNAALQFAIAASDAESARNAGIANIIGSTGATMAGVLSSTDIQKELDPMSLPRSDPRSPYYG